MTISLSFLPYKFSLAMTSETGEIIFIFIKYFFLSIPVLKGEGQNQTTNGTATGLLYGAENMAVRPNSASTLLILTRETKFSGTF